MIEIILIIILLVLFVVVSAAWLLEQRMGIINVKTFQRNLELQDEQIKDLKKYISRLEAQLEICEVGSEF